jgi:osmotically-inducible protein OsmY
MEHIANRTDEELQNAVEMALKLALKGVAPHVGVAADNGTVTLSGQVRTDAERTAAHDATLEVWGIHAVANDIAVRDHRSGTPTDTDIAQAAQAALRRADDVPKDAILAEVTDQVVILTGHTATFNERFAAERVVGYVWGVVRIDNRITVGNDA